MLLLCLTHFCFYYSCFYCLRANAFFLLLLIFFASAESALYQEDIKYFLKKKILTRFPPFEELPDLHSAAPPVPRGEVEGGVQLGEGAVAHLEEEAVHRGQGQELAAEGVLKEREYGLN